MVFVALFTGFFDLSSSALAQTMVLPGTFDVSPLGNADFSIPIAAPPGTGGMVPALSLDYTSGGANGVAGVGWKIDGLPSITRCPQTLAQDGAAGSVTYDVSVSVPHGDVDRFCLNGQRLIAINGNYGADGTEYRTETESYSRIVSHGYTGSSPTYFDVYTKAGRIMEFGNTTDSRTMFANTSSFASARAWLLDQISDTAGNYVSVKYTVNPDSNVSNNNEVVPAEVDYTGNSNTGMVPYNKITFVYANGTRPDIFPEYTDGNLVEMTQLLTDVKTWTGTQSSPGSTEVNDYTLSYTTSSSTGRELMTNAAICDGTGSNCLAPRVFTYSTNPGGAIFTLHSSTLGGWNFGAPPSAYWSPIVGDFIGNGRTDFAFIANNQLYVALSNGDGTFSYSSKTLSLNFGAPPTAYWAPILGDFNGDGKTDFAFISGSGSNNQIYTFLSNGDGTFKVVSQLVSGYLGSPPDAYWTSITGDFYGNGMTDVAFLGPSSIYVLTSKGDGTFSTSTQNLSSLNLGAPPDAEWTPITGDFTGNGKTDFALIQGNSSGNQIYTFLSSGNGSFNVVSQIVGGYLGAPPSAYWTPVKGDFNGDGLTDVTFVTGGSGQNSDSTNFYTLLSTGNGQFSPVESSLDGGLGSPPTADWTPITGDFNGDGLTDLGFLTGNAFGTYISNGNGTFSTGSQNQYLSTNYGAPPSATWTSLAGDFSGGGQGDFLFVQNSTLNTYLSNDVIPDLLTSVTNGIGASTSVTYGTPSQGAGTYYSGWSTSSGNSCSTSRAANSYPATSIDIAPAIPVVTTVSDSNGAGGKYLLAYGYSCALADITGRGYLGFATEAVKDQQTGIQQTNSYYQNYPFIGALVAQSKTVVVNGTTVTLGSTTNTYSVLTHSTTPALPWNNNSTSEVAPQFPYISKSVVSGSDLNGAALPTTTATYTYDAYGDPLTVAISKAFGGTQGPTQTTTDTYLTPNTTAPHWLLGLISQSQVVRTTP